MNWANRLTVMRMGIIPVFLVFLYWQFPYSMLVAAILFTIASLTDILDGYVARREKKVTVFGKVFDPIADKLLVLAALVVLVEQGEVPSLIAIVIIAREILISGFRIVAAGKGEIISASWLGKTKTVLQDISVILFLLHNLPPFTWLDRVWLPQIAIAAALVFTVWSTIDYFVVNRNAFFTEE